MDEVQTAEAGEDRVLRCGMVFGLTQPTPRALPQPQSTHIGNGQNPIRTHTASAAHTHTDLDPLLSRFDPS